MVVRPIDANELLDIERLLDTDVIRKSKTASWLLDQVLHDIQAMPTLTPTNEWISVEDEIPSDDDDGLEFFCMTNATGKGGGVLPLEWGVATIRGKTVRRWRWLNRISPWTVTHWMKRPAPPKKERDHE